MVAEVPRSAMVNLPASIIAGDGGGAVISARPMAARQEPPRRPFQRLLRCPPCRSASVLA